MNPKKLKSKKPTLDELVFGALSQLQALQYSNRSIRHYQATWNRLIKFAKQNNFENKLSKNLIIEFLKYHNINLEKLTNVKHSWREYAERSLKILWQYSQYGYFERIHTLIHKLTIPPAMAKVLSEYVIYCKEKLFISEYSYNQRIRQIGLFMDYATKQNVKSFDEIQPQHLSKYISMLWRYSSRTVSRVVSDIRQFLKYLFLRDLVSRDISQALPTVHSPLHSKIPSVWDKKLLVKLLAAVDRSSPRGK